MSVPLIYEKGDLVNHVGTLTRVYSDVDICLEFTPISNVRISSEAFNTTKNRIVNIIGAGAIWDNTGKISVHLCIDDPDRNQKANEIKKLVARTYSALLEMDEFRENEFIQVAPGIWMLESDAAMAKLDEEGQRKLDEVLKEIFTERPLKMFISSPRGK